MRILVLGADGYLGWPTMMYFSERGHDVYGIDNYFKRKASLDLGAEPLFPNPNLNLRAQIWKELTGKTIGVVIGDLTDF